VSDGDKIDREKLLHIVREVIDEVMREPVPPKTGAPVGTVEPVAPRPSRLGPAHRSPPRLHNPGAIDALVSANPARLIQGRTGTRYLTEVYLGLRADHAIALDAVASEVPDAWPEQHGLIPLRSRCVSHDEFLLYPDHGRRLDDASRARLEKEGDKGSDVQIIAGDGLSAHALLTNGPQLVAALLRDLPAAGFKVGRPVFVKHARIGVQDEVGVVLGAKSTLIIVGERPGLGTGDSLSIYTAYGPSLGQSNSEKDCISNVRTLGFPPERASGLCAELLRRTFAAGGGGVKLV
jgi:ethanolamine ammonia-lyase small subunit